MRTPGTPLTETNVTIHIPQEWLLTVNRKQYVFVSAISAKVREVSMSAFKTTKGYSPFVVGVSRGLYNTIEVYGLTAISVSEPQKRKNAINLKFVIGEGEDEAVRVI